MPKTEGEKREYLLGYNRGLARHRERTDQYPESVVDYGAWERGYMPPSEHILIDQLAYRGATVNTSSDLGECAFWIVTRGFRPHGEKVLRIYELLHELAIEEFKAKKAEAEKLKAPRPDDLLPDAPPQVTGEMDTPSGPQVTNGLSHGTPGK